LLDVALLVESLKAIEFTFLRKDIAIAEAQVHTLRVLFTAVLNTVQPFRLKLESNKRMDNSRFDLLAALNVIENIVRTSDSFSPSRQAALLIVTEIVAGSPAYNEKEALKLKGFVRRIVALSNFSHDVRVACDSSFLYFHQDILAPIVASIYKLPTEANRLQYIMGSFNDGIKMCQMVAHRDATPFFLAYRSFLRDTLRAHIIEPLCRDIENDLRMHIHTKHLDHMQTINPKTENLRPLRPFLDLTPVRVLGLMINIKNEVTHYLDTNFYNLTTVALHDWRTYSDMRSLAAEKLGLALMDNFLPMGSLEQGLDVLQIMRNIHIFVGRFTYNMNMQQFVEFRPDKSSKHLNTIKIQSIAASIRQHGLGVLNTTVNFTYQFLAQKFHIFSQFLYDDYIRAHLSREHRWFKKHKNEAEVNNMYPYDRALKFVRDIRKLGVNETGKSFLDQFRILITEIGNALGYVRMVRSASMYYCSEAVKFLPDFEDVISFENYSGKKGSTGAEGGPGVVASEGKPGAGLSDETVRAGKNLDEVIATLVKNFGEGSDYFKVLVNVFQSVLLTAEHEHLRTFYMIVPALCISWVEASLQAKDAMFKAVRGVTREMYFTDDGFSVGVAYCLAILKQTRKNEALHWVETVRNKHRIDAKLLADQQAVRAAKEAAIKERKDKEERSRKGIVGFFTSKPKKEVEEEDDYEDMEEVHTLQVTGKRLEAQRRESEQLFYSMSGAGIFFKRTDVDI